MKALYDEYFHVPKNGKISDKVMLVRVASIVVTMIVCLIAMSLSAYAYFSHSVTSASNVIKAADFDVKAAVTVTQDATSETVEANEDGSYSLESGTYSVTLEKAGTATTGFCIVEVTVGESTKTYHTQQIGVGGVEKLLRFTLDLSQLSESDTVTVRFTPHWGTSHYYGYQNNDDNELYIKEGSSVTITAAPLEIGDEEESTDPTETTPTELG